MILSLACLGLEELPNELKWLSCWCNKLTMLPKLPDKILDNLLCYSNHLSLWYSNDWRHGEDLVQKMRKRINNEMRVKKLIKVF